MIISRLCGTPCPAVWPEVGLVLLYTSNHLQVDIVPGYPLAWFPTVEAQETVQEESERGVLPPDAQLGIGAA